MKFLLLSALFLVAFAQSIPPSTNPPGANYFSPSAVTTLTLGQPVSSVISNSTASHLYYQIFIPSWVGSVRYTLNNTSPSIAYNYAEAHVNFAYNRDFDDTVSFPCYYSYVYGQACDGYDEYLYAFTGDFREETYSAGSDFVPGAWQYISIYKYYNDPEPVQFTFEVDAIFSCSPNSTVGVQDYTSQSCISDYDIYPVTYNGQGYYGYLNDSSSFSYFKVNVPQNVSRLWAWITADYYNLNAFIAPHFIPTSSYNAWEYITYYSGYNSTTGQYNYFIEIELPNYDTNFYFAITNNPGLYYIQFFWDACGAYNAGFGQMSNDWMSAQSYFSIPDCSDPVEATNIVPSSLGTVFFNLPAYNPATDVGYAAAYGFMHVAEGTVGYLNFTCSSTVDNTRIVIAKNQPVDCYLDYTWYMYCDGPNSYSNSYFLLLSEDLYTGGYWSVGACSYSSEPSTVYLVSTGNFPAAPSPSATPSVTPSRTPSSSPASSVSPSSLPVPPSPSTSPDDDSSSSDGPSEGEYILLLIIGFLVGVIVGLILGFILYSKLQANKRAASNAYVPLQPYPVAPGMIPVHMPMYPALN